MRNNQLNRVMKKSIQQFKTKKCFEELANKRMEKMKDLKVNKLILIN